MQAKVVEINYPKGMGTGKVKGTNSHTGSGDIEMKYSAETVTQVIGLLIGDWHSQGIDVNAMTAGEIE
ncbi:MAG: hypothetical protein OHK0052_17170 [Anaerolineales bacterium]